MEQFFTGISYVFKGFSLIFKPELRRYVIIPTLINILLLMLLWGTAIHYMGSVVDYIDSYLPHWLSWLNVILWPLMFIALAFTSAYSFTLISNLILSPFMGLLSEKTQLYLKGQPIPSVSIAQVVKDTPKILGRQLLLWRYMIPRALLLLVITFIPGINLIAGLLWFVFGGWMLAIQYLDYPSDNNRHPLRYTLKSAGEHKSHILGFGVMCMILTSIPILNILLIPAAVVGATAFYTYNTTSHK